MLALLHSRLGSAAADGAVLGAAEAVSRYSRQTQNKHIQCSYGRIFGTCCAPGAFVLLDAAFRSDALTSHAFTSLKQGRWQIQDIAEQDAGAGGFFGDLGGVDDDLGGALEVRDADHCASQQHHHVITATHEATVTSSKLNTHNSIGRYRRTCTHHHLKPGQGNVAQ